MFHNQLDYVCSYCNRSFIRKHNLQMHIENFHMNSSCVCEICDQRFGSPAGLQIHLSRGHNRYNQAFPECDICGRIFTRKQSIISHMITVHFQRFQSHIKCKFCKKIFTTDRNLKRHINQLHNSQEKYSLTIDDCNKGLNKYHLRNKVYTNNRSLKRHMEFHGEKGEFKCDICPKVYTSYRSLRYHIRTRHKLQIYDKKNFKCEFCFKNIVGENNVICHMAFYHKQCVNSNIFAVKKQQKFNQYCCSNCNMHFEKEYLLRQHVKLKHSFKDFYKYCKKALLKLRNRSIQKSKSFYKCKYCKKAFSSLYYLKDHVRREHTKKYYLSTCNVCYSNFYSKKSMLEHKKICLPPFGVNSCSHCDKLFSDVCSLEFHTKIFHPQAQIAESTNSLPTNINETYLDVGSYKCTKCDRIYYTDRSLKHHIKLKHSADEAMKCEYCGKICNNKYYLLSHIKTVHRNCSSLKCDYCDKQFKSKRNIRHHIEYTHLGIQRYKCIECETLFKEKRSLRKHVRIKHPNAESFPQCHICHKRFESAKSCKIHLKLLHSFNMNTYPCDSCSLSFNSKVALSIHLQNTHLAEDEIYKREQCNLVFKGHEKFEQHNDLSHVNLVPRMTHKVLPRCIICFKDFSTRKTLKRHIKNFHKEFDVEELAAFGQSLGVNSVECKDCIKTANDETHLSIYQKLKHFKESIIFKCETCLSSYNTLEYAILRYKSINLANSNSKMILSELCTAEMSDDDIHASHTITNAVEMVEAESTTNDIKIEISDHEYEVIIEPLST